MLLSRAVPTMAQENEAKALLDRMTETFNASNGVFIMYSVQSEGEYSEGTIQLKGEKFLLKSPGMTTWFDGHTQWTYLEANDEVNISEPAPEELQTLSPFAWIGLYRQGYTLQMTSNDKRASIIVMEATNPDAETQRVRLYVAHGKLCPTEIRMRRRYSDEDIIIKISACEADGKNYPDSMFVFNKKEYPTAEIIDLR